MADEFNISTRHRAILVKLLHAAQSKTSANSLITELQRQKDKFPKKSLQSILLEIAKIDKLAERVSRDLQQDFKTETSVIECLQRFLVGYEKLKFTRKTSRQNIETIAEDEEASTSHKNNLDQLTENIEPSTSKNEDDVKENNVKDTSKKMMNTTTDSVNKSAEISTVRDTIQNIDSALSVGDTRVHSQLFFSKAIIDSLPLQNIQPNCAARSIPEQEQILIDDLLYCFIGIPGDFIVFHINEENENESSYFEFKISDQIDISLQNIAHDLLPMANHYSTIQQFSQWGDKLKNQVSHALSEVIQTILNDYRISVTQLEKEKINNNLTLHKLHYLIRPNAQKLQILSGLIGKIYKSDLKSGTILSILYDEITLQTGDQMSQKMLIELTERASVPYIEMLERWILKGYLRMSYLLFYCS